VRPAHPALVGELEDALRARVERAVDGVAEAGRVHPRGVHRLRHVARDGVGLLAGEHATARFRKQLRACLGRAEDDRATAEDAGRHGTLERARIGVQRHPRRDVRRHHAVLGDRHQQQVEKVALVVARLLTGQQQVEVGGEAESAHDVARQIASPDLDTVGVGLGDGADGAAGGGLADLHAGPG
jgi:hypothetical protein